MNSISHKDAAFLEGYAQALQDLILTETGVNSCAKSYDPMTINVFEGAIYSYAFDLKTGRRHHPLTDFESIEEIKQLMLSEAVDQLK